MGANLVRGVLHPCRALWALGGSRQCPECLGELSADACQEICHNERLNGTDDPEVLCSANLEDSGIRRAMCFVI